MLDFGSYYHIAVTLKHKTCIYLEEKYDKLMQNFAWRFKNIFLFFVCDFLQLKFEGHKDQMVG